MRPFYLNILPLDKLIPVEKPVPSRISAIRSEFERSNHQPNPLIVARESNGDYFLMQGVNQCYAMKNLGIDSVVVQEIEPASNAAEFLSWYHLVKHFKPEFLFAIAEHLKLQYAPIAEPLEADPQQGRYMLCVFFNGETYKIIKNSNSLIEQVSAYNKFVESYQSCSSYLKLYPDKIFVEATELFDHESAMIIPPGYNRQEIRQLALAQVLFPQDYLNIVLNNRIVGLDFPLEVLRSDDDLDEKKMFLKELIRLRFQKSGSNVHSGKVFILNGNNMQSGLYYDERNYSNYSAGNKLE